jgi:hypothetical protein
VLDRLWAIENAARSYIFEPKRGWISTVRCSMAVDNVILAKWWLRFMAPELFSEEDNDGFPLKTLASDIYAFGQTIVEVRYFYPPRHSRRDSNIYFCNI